MDPLKITVAIPVYNAEGLIARCIESIIAQAYPRDKLEIIVVDGRSEDHTIEVAKRYDVRLLDNPLRLADYGARIAVRNMTGDLYVVFAADNGLATKDWCKKVADVFTETPDLAACWGPMVPSLDDPPLNKYYTLIQNDPLSFFVNKNLTFYLKHAEVKNFAWGEAFIFNMSPERPLVWGANGLVYRANLIRDLILREEFLGDNDLFQEMLEHGYVKVAYIPSLTTYHHHVRRMSDWQRKWKRNFKEHLLAHYEDRNMRWAFTGDFVLRTALWAIYSFVFPISFFHALYLAFKWRNPHWFFHPLVSFLQALTYLYIVLSSTKGRRLLRDLLTARLKR